MGAQQANMRDARQRQLMREGIEMRRRQIQEGVQGSAPQVGAASFMPGTEPATRTPADANQGPMIPGINRPGLAMGPGYSRRM